MKFQLGTSSLNDYGDVRKLPYVFTEKSIAMLATILRTQVADIVSMKIIDAFVYMRKYLAYDNKYANKELFDILRNIDKKIQQTIIFIE